MCGRFTNRMAWEEIVRLYRITEPWIRPASNFPPRYNIAPTQDAPVVRSRNGTREVALLRWGLVPYWSKDMKGGARLINCQSETAGVKPAFREAWTRRRCLIAADGFYEWPEPSKPRFVTLRDDAPFAFAGLWERWKKPDGGWLETFTILTTVANTFLAVTHERMPVILTPENFAKWLGEEPATQDELKALCVPLASELMISWAVHPAVGNVKNDEPSLITAV